MVPGTFPASSHLYPSSSLEEEPGTYLLLVKGQQSTYVTTKALGSVPSLAWEAVGPWARLFISVLQFLICKMRVLPTPLASGVENTGSTCWPSVVSEMPNLICKANIEVV